MKHSILFIFLLTSVIVFTNCEKKEALMQNGAVMALKLADPLLSMQAEEAYELMDTADFYLIDLRLHTDYRAGYIPEAVNIPRGMLEFIIDKDAFWEGQDLLAPDTDELIILYSRKGPRSILAVQTLHKMGYTQVKYLEGGYKSWEKAFPNDAEWLDDDEEMPIDLEQLCGC